MNKPEPPPWPSPKEYDTPRDWALDCSRIDRYAERSARRHEAIHCALAIVAGSAVGGLLGFFLAWRLGLF